jgi:NAD(P)-dependent dehydrogenase (short-subunit alcohol dehydrogenase family)
MAEAGTLADMPDQSGKTAIVTGATSGLGLETARVLAGAGADVILAARDPAKGETALDDIRASHPGARVRFELVDLASLDSVRDFAERLQAHDLKLDLLINNAGLMAIPTRHTTADGFEMQFGVNYLAHFALTRLLMPNLLAAAKSRVVNLSSIAHKQGALDFADMESEHKYSAWTAYARSKLAMLMFSFDLARKAQDRGWPLLSIAAHPGFSVTNLSSTGPRMGKAGASLLETAIKLGGPVLGQSAARGALPTLYAATSGAAANGGYYGPDGFMELAGDVKPAKVGRQAIDRTAQARLWAYSQGAIAVKLPGEWPA